MLSLLSDKVVYDESRCTQCGTCIAACPVGAIDSLFSKKDGVNKIRVDEEKCIKCSACINVCAANYIHKHRLTDDDFEKLNEVVIGFAKNEKIRHDSSSGGLARTIIKNALEKGICDKAYCLMSSEAFPWAKGMYLSGKADTTQIANSKYLPILLNRNLKKEEKKCKLLIVGTNCQLIAATKFFEGTDVELIKIGLLCKQQKNIRFTEFIKKQLKTSGEEPVNYRGDGWPGKIWTTKSGMKWEDAAAFTFGKNLWRVSGCRYCGHCLGVDADITLADPWGIRTKKQVDGGANLIIVQTDIGLSILNGSEGVVVSEELDLQSLKKSISWEEYKKKIEAIGYYNQESISMIRKIRFFVSDLQRKFYELLLQNYISNPVLIKILNKMPYVR